MTDAQASWIAMWFNDGSCRDSTSEPIIMTFHTTGAEYDRKKRL